MPPKRRRRIHGLYYHSSPPKVIPMGNPVKPKVTDHGKEAIVIKPSNIRIWIHDKDVGKLSKVVWEGQGNRLRTEVSSNGKVKRFLEAVPFVMNIIKDIHSAVVDNDIETLMERTASVPAVLLSSKDTNGLTPLHKAAGLAHTRILEYLLTMWPDSATEPDFTGKTPLHWASSAKNNSRAYNLLVQAGADEEALDYKMKTPAHYKQKPNDIDRSQLTVVPDAPRVPQPGLPATYDWSMFATDATSRLALNNNFVRKSQSNYEAFNVLSDQSSPTNGTIKRYSSTDAIRNGTLAGGGGGSILSPSMSRLTVQTPPSPRVPSAMDAEAAPEIGDTPLTTEELAVLVAINPENELLYKNVGSAQAESTENGTGTDASTADVDSNNNDTVDDPEMETDLLDQEDTIDVDVEIGEPEDQLPEEADTNGDNEDNEENINDADELAEDETTESAPPEDEEQEAEDGDNVEGDEAGNGVEDANDEQESNEAADEEPDKIDENKENEEPNNGEEIVDAQIDDLENADSQSNEDIENAPDDDEAKDSAPEDEAAADDEDAVGDPPPYEDSNDGVEADDEAAEDEEDKSEKADEVSPSPALDIEGVVVGEADNGGVQSEGGQHLEDDTDEEAKIQAIIRTGDMEQLASLVLNGEGRKLISLTSDQPEIQAFLDNVPAYMNKIRRVHLAAREGSLRDLQSALDRRKFAVAKDEISPSGATPLHVAAAFGHAGIVRYLAGRFPETTSAVDDNGRTALHYAATLKDNGHFYNMLTNLGANPKAEDNTGKSAEFYLDPDNQSNHGNTHRHILKQFGAEDSYADEMLSDQELSGEHSSQVEIPLFRTEEGRYLATTLGDPLIKGLTEVANSRPTDPIAFLANYLHGFSKTKNSVPIEAILAPTDKSVSATEDMIQPKPIENTEQEPSTNDDSPEMAPSSDDRDEHGQSLLHFACARSHAQNALIDLINESGVDITYRDELYRTARDVSYQASQGNNAREIDKYVLGFATRGDQEFFEHLLLEGYDHIRDAEDNREMTVAQVALEHDHPELVHYLESIEEFEQVRELLHRAIRQDNVDEVRAIIGRPDGSRLARAKNYYGRTSMHLAVLLGNEDVVDMISTQFRQTLRIGDNLDRTPLHYAMGVQNVEALSRILIRNGAKRVLKDLKGRQPSYYFMNKADISRLKEEEEDNENERDREAAP